MTFFNIIRHTLNLLKNVIHRSEVNSKNVHTPYNLPTILALSVPLKTKIHNGLYVPLTKLENTYYGTSKVGPVHAKEAYGKVAAQLDSFLT